MPADSSPAGLPQSLAKERQASRHRLYSGRVFSGASGGEIQAAIALLCVATAAASVSPIIVARRWGFVGEGIGHSSFGGAGVVWLLACVLPQVEALRGGGAALVGAALGALVAAMLIGGLARGRGHDKLGSDTAVGIVLVGSLALGFLARRVFEARFGGAPVGADALLFGAGIGGMTWGEAGVAAGVLLAVAGGMVLFRREVLSYAFDPELSALNGVPTTVVHYGLLVAIALVVAAGARLVGAVLVTALLVLPGATAAIVSRRLVTAWGVGVGTALLAAGGAAATTTVLETSLPVGPVVVIYLILLFCVAVVIEKWKHATAS